MRSLVEAELRLKHLISNKTISNMLDFIARFFIGIMVLIVGAISLVFITPIALIALFGSAVIALIGIIIDLIDGLVRRK